jgi:hypothetical protein
MSKSHVHFYESSPLNKANIPLDKFWNLPDDRRLDFYYWVYS